MENKLELPQAWAETEQSGPLISQRGVLHHLGFVVRSISKDARNFAGMMGLTWDEKIFHDPTQQVRVSFFYPLDMRNPVYELVEPASETSPVAHFLKKGGGLHHVCYEIDDIEAALMAAQKSGMAVVSRPTPAVAFEGRRIAWVCSRSRMLMEFLERGLK